MNNNAFQALINLVDFDQKTVSIEKNIKKIKEEITDLKIKKADLEADIEDVRHTLHEVQKEVDMGELEMKEYDQKIKEDKIKLDQVSNQKEYIALKKEIEGLESKQHDNEEPLIEAWNRLEQVKLECEKKEEAFGRKNQEIIDAIEEKITATEKLEQELEEHKAGRDQMLQKVPEEWREKYKMLGAKVSDPVVQVSGSSCSACFYIITPQNIIEMKRGKLLQCKGCYRFLYIKQATEE